MAMKIKYTENIPIIIVPYWEKNNMENYIVDKLNKLEINKTIN